MGSREMITAILRSYAHSASILSGQLSGPCYLPRLIFYYTVYRLVGILDFLLCPSNEKTVSIRLLLPG